jgi:4-deoxy-L-threo-5-hexosulose-uronate ketol-isomerase
MTSRYSINPSDFKTYDAERIRSACLIHDMFITDQITATYFLDDRMIVGGAFPVNKKIDLKTYPALKSVAFLDRRELGIINIGDIASVSADGIEYSLQHKEALYIGKDTKEVFFHPAVNGQARFYFNSTPAHCKFPTRKISLSEAETTEIGSLNTSNHRTIYKLIVNSVVPTCQLQMGLTELKPGSVWNTMPPHTHDRRMEVYFYFNLKENNTVCHFLGEPTESRHVWVRNHEAVLSPPWSLHCGAGTSNYSFIWGMAGENLDYSDMDQVSLSDLR